MKQTKLYAKWGNIAEETAVAAAIYKIHHILAVGNKKVYIKITSGCRKGSIAYIQQMINHSYSSRSRVSAVLKWDDRANIARCNINDMIPAYAFLEDYNGPTIWEKLDSNTPVTTKILDMRKNVLVIGDTVVYIRGNPSTLHYGVIKKFSNRIRNGKYQTAVTVAGIDGKRTKSIYPHRTILKVTGTALEHDAILSKLGG